MFIGKRTEKTENTIDVGADGVIRLTYKGPQTLETMLILKERLLKVMAEQRQKGQKVRVLADMRQITATNSDARIEGKWFLEKADYDALAILGNRYLQPLVFFVLRDFKNPRKVVKYFTDQSRAIKWLANPTQDENFNRLRPHNKLKWAMLILIVLVLASTVSSWFQLNERFEVEAEYRFQGVVASGAGALSDRLEIYTETLYGFRGLFHSSDEVNEREYNEYLSSLELADKYPGFNSINFITALTDAQLPAFVDRVRNDRSFNPQGDPDFHVNPKGHDVHFIVTYVGVEGAGSGRGNDLADSEERRSALEAARDSGKPTATTTIKLLNKDGEEQQNVPGFLVTIPIYKDNVPSTLTERRTMHEGFVNAVFNYQKLFDQALKNSIPKEVMVRILDSAGTVVYEQNQAPAGALKAVVSIPVADRKWGMEVQAPELYGVSRSEFSLRYYVAAFGLSLVTLLITVLWLQNRGRKQAIDLASDMTEDIRTERNNAVATKNKVEAILSSIGDGVFVLDKEGKVLLLNRAAEFISGVSIREAQGRHFKEVLTFVNEKSGQSSDDFIAVALAGQADEMSANTILKRKDGSVVPVADSASPVLDAEGKVIGAVVVFRDITREKQLDLMKDELLSVASHELRTPMGAVRANVSMILAGDYGPVNKDLVEPLTDIKASTIRLVELVNDLLSVARLEAGRMKFTLSEFDIQPLLKTEVANLSPLGKEKGVKLIFEPGKTVIVQADADKVKQIVNNLVGNALKFTQKGSITVATEENKDEVIVTVTDTGIGIASDDQKKLFGKFQQITSVQDGKPAGTGLGLYISLEMMHKMGGSLSLLRSEPDKGSVFAFTVPKPKSQAAKKAKAAIEYEAELHPDQK